MEPKDDQPQAGLLQSCIYDLHQALIREGFETSPAEITLILAVITLKKCLVQLVNRGESALDGCFLKDPANPKKLLTGEALLQALLPAEEKSYSAFQEQLAQLDIVLGRVAKEEMN